MSIISMTPKSFIINEEKGFELSPPLIEDWNKFCCDTTGVDKTIAAFNKPPADDVRLCVGMDWIIRHSIHMIYKGYKVVSLGRYHYAFITQGYNILHIKCRQEAITYVD